jgi:hypothetical protein
VVEDIIVECIKWPPSDDNDFLDFLRNKLLEIDNCEQPSSSRVFTLKHDGKVAMVLMHCIEQLKFSLKPKAKAGNLPPSLPM